MKMDWEKLKIFHVVAKAGSFTEAGLILNLAQSSVSRHITQLEESLKTSLFHRHSRGLALTAQGEYLFKTTHDMNERLNKVQTQLEEMQNHDEGPLVVTTTRFFGETWLDTVISEFIKQNPKIKLTLKYCDHELDLSMREADIALRMIEPKKQDLIQRHLIRFNFGLFAHKDYLAKNPALETLEDLKQHHIICFEDGFESPFHDRSWIYRLDQSFPIQSHREVTKTQSLTTNLYLVSNAIGVTCLPKYMTRGYDDLVPVLTHIEHPSSNCYLCYPEELKSHQRIKTFRDFILSEIKNYDF